MGRRGRRPVLQLGDSSDGFLGNNSIVFLPVLQKLLILFFIEFQ
jgi:hypothetical protein